MSVRNNQEYLEVPKEESPLKTVTSKTSDFINETSMKGTQNVMIMTEGASQRLDGIAEQQRSEGPNPKYTNVIRKARNKYLSKYSNGKEVTAAQYITEIICEHKPF